MSDCRCQPDDFADHVLDIAERLLVRAWRFGHFDYAFADAVEQAIVIALGGEGDEE